MVLGSDRVVHPRGAGPVPQVRDLVLEAAAPGVWAAEPTHLPAEGARGRRRETPLQLDLHEPAQGDVMGCCGCPLTRLFVVFQARR